MIGKVMDGVSSWTCANFSCTLMRYFYIFQQHADLAITDLTMTSDRITAIDFSPSIMNLGKQINYKFLHTKARSLKEWTSFFLICFHRNCYIVSNSSKKTAHIILVYGSVIQWCLDVAWHRLPLGVDLFLHFGTNISSTMGKSLSVHRRAHLFEESIQFSECIVVRRWSVAPARKWNWSEVSQTPKDCRKIFICFVLQSYFGSIGIIGLVVLYADHCYIVHCELGCILSGWK